MCVVCLHYRKPSVILLCDAKLRQNQSLCQFLWKQYMLQCCYCDAFFSCVDYCDTKRMCCTKFDVFLWDLEAFSSFYHGRTEMNAINQLGGLLNYFT